VLDYDWGPDFKPVDGSGVASNAPPPIRRVLPMYAPKVNEDGNELGGVPVVLLDAPLGTYLGWNVTAAGAMPFHKDQICNYVGGMVPFARTAADRKNDERRKPAELLAFTGVRPGMTALDVSASGGYTTELIARAVGPTATGRTTRTPRPSRCCR